MKNTLTSILKLVIFLLVLPLIVASVLAFQTQVLSIPANEEAWILWGAGIFVVFNFFIYDFKEVYVFGKVWMEKIFTSFKPAAYVVPVYAILLILVLEILLIFGKGYWQGYFLFAIAFMLVMHWTHTAQEIYESDKSILKAHYFLSFGAILVVNLFFIALLLAWVIPEFSWVGFMKSLVAQTSHLYKSVFKALFVDSR